jgi:hypothetical protein
MPDCLIVKLVIFILGALLGYIMVAAISGTMLSSRISKMEDEHKSK